MKALVLDSSNPLCNPARENTADLQTCVAAADGTEPVAVVSDRKASWTGFAIRLTVGNVHSLQ